MEGVMEPLSSEPVLFGYYLSITYFISKRHEIHAKKIARETTRVTDKKYTFHECVYTTCRKKKLPSVKPRK